jgi:hypothetical protein
VLVLGNFTQRKRIVHPPLGGLIKSCVTLYQPILQKEFDGSYSGVPTEMLEYCLRSQWRDRGGVGPLFRQFSGQTQRIDQNDPLIEFDSVRDNEARRLSDIAAQAYTLLNESVARDTYIYEDGTRTGSREEFMNLLAKLNTRTANALRKMTPGKYKQMMEEATARRSKEGKFPRKSAD